MQRRKLRMLWILGTNYLLWSSGLPLKNHSTFILGSPTGANWHSNLVVSISTKVVWLWIWVTKRGGCFLSTSYRSSSVRNISEVYFLIVASIWVSASDFFIPRGTWFCSMMSGNSGIRVMSLTIIQVRYHLIKSWILSTYVCMKRCPLWSLRRNH